MRTNFESKPWFFPLPVLIIATYDENGHADAMNAAWGGLYEADQVEKRLRSVLPQKSVWKPATM